MQTLSKSNELRVVFPLEPVPASRPRVTQFGTFYGKGYKDWMAQAGRLMETIPEGLDRIDHPVAVEVRVVATKPKTGKLMFPRGDCDNYAKGPLDVMTKAGVWKDDSLVASLSITKRYAEPGESASTEVIVRALS